MDRGMALVFVVPAVLVLVLCSILSLESSGATAAEAMMEAMVEEDFHTFPSSQMKDEAIYRSNLGKWLDYVHETSDTDDENGGNEYQVAEESQLQTQDKKKKKNYAKFKPKRTIVVAKDGSGHFQSIQAAINDVPKVNKERVLIKIKAGVYSEQVTISRKKPYITLEGERPHKNGSELRTVIEFNATAADLSKIGVPVRTFGSATVAVNAKNFIAKYITIKNTAPTPLPGAVGGQAVALRVSADMAAFYVCRFYGKQDTLYDHMGRHFFKSCYAEGTIDFVFGNGRSLYESCHLNALENNGTYGTMTAQKRNATSLETGFAFVHSLVTGYGSAFLGRAWGNDSRVVFANTFMSKVVIPQGWDDWGIPAREKTVFYAEYNCTGPGANSTGRVHWSEQLTFKQAKPFLSIGFINGKKWLQNPKKLEAEERHSIAAEERQAKALAPP
ncbi:unnamed protein product [Calypogeia fissa]